MERLFFVAGCLFGFLGVTLGALGAHALKGYLDVYGLKVFEIGIRYQMYHAFALFGVAWAWTKWPGTGLKTSGWLFIAGTVMFSGSLYALSLAEVRWLWVITPVGGLVLISAWLCMAWSVWKR